MNEPCLLRLSNTRRQILNIKVKVITQFSSYLTSFSPEFKENFHKFHPYVCMYRSSVSLSEEMTQSTCVQLS